MRKLAYVISDGNITVNYDGQTHIVKRTDALADRLIDAIRNGKLEEIPTLVSAAKRVEAYSKGKFTVKDGQVFVNGVPAPEVLSAKIIRFSNDGLPVEPLVAFAENLQANPSYRAVNELYTFLEKNDHPLTEDGNFIAYKRVKGDFKDIHSGTMDNSPGNTLEMPRNQVNEDSNQTCSYGLHVANWNYAHTQFASDNSATDVMLEVEVNPAHVVSIPVDYNNSKMRVCKYKVLGVVSQPYEPTEALRITHMPDSTEPEDETCGDGDCTTCHNDDEVCGSCGDACCFGECEEVETCCDACGEELDDPSYCPSCDEHVNEPEPYPWEDEII